MISASYWSSLALLLILVTASSVNADYTTTCAAGWTPYGAACCSPAYGLLNGTAEPHIVISQGVEEPDAFGVWSQPDTASIGLDTDFLTLNIMWGLKTGPHTVSGVSGIIQNVTIYYETGKGVFGIQFVDDAGVSPVLGTAYGTAVSIIAPENNWLSGFGAFTLQNKPLTSLTACFQPIIHDTDHTKIKTDQQ